MPTSDETIQEPTNLVAFFRQELKRAFDELGIEPSEQTEAYLVQMLNSFSRIDADRIEEIGFDKPAAIMLGEAMNATGEERFEAYRRVGDLSLFNCGFFGSHLTRRAMNEDYYHDVGKTAYKRLNDILSFKKSEGIFLEIFQELMIKFNAFVEAFRHLSEQESESQRRLRKKQLAKLSEQTDVSDLDDVSLAELALATNQDDS